MATAPLYDHEMRYQAFKRQCFDVRPGQYADVKLLSYDGSYKLPNRKKEAMVTIKHPNGACDPLKYLVLEPGASKTRLVIRSGNHEPWVNLELDYESALALRDKINDAVGKMVDDRVVNTVVQSRF